MAGLSASSGFSASPSSLESRLLSPVAVTQLWGAGSGLGAWTGDAAGSRGPAVEAEEPPGTLRQMGE